MHSQTNWKSLRLEGIIYSFRINQNLQMLGDDEKSHREVGIHYRVRNCENIVNILDVFQNNNVNTGQDHLLIVMECMEGGELFNRIQQRHQHGFTENG